MVQGKKCQFELFAAVSIILMIVLMFSSPLMAFAVEATSEEGVEEAIESDQITEDEIEEDLVEILDEVIADESKASADEELGSAENEIQLAAIETPVSTADELEAAILAQNENIVLLNDISITSGYTINYPVSIQSSDGSAYSIKWAGAANGKMFTIGSNGRLTLTNAVLDGTGKYVMLVQINGGTLVMNSGSVLRNTQTDSANNAVRIGALGTSTGGTLTMNGNSLITGVMLDVAVVCYGGIVSLNDTASISQNSARGVNVSSGTLTMSGTSSISNNTTPAGRPAAGVLASSSSVITMGVASGDAPSISNNKATDSYGGGIYLTESTLNMNYGASISGNTASTMAGGVGSLNSSINMTSSSMISGNHSAAGAGGGAFLSSSQMTIQDSASVSGNALDSGMGGGVYLQNAGSILSLFGSASISGNSADSGGGVLLRTGTSLIMGNSEGDIPSINSNIATGSGGGISIASGATATLTAGSIVEGNTAGVTGAGVMQQGTLTISQNIQISDGLYFNSLAQVPIITEALGVNALIQLESSEYVAEENAPIEVAVKGDDYAATQQVDCVAFLAPRDFDPSFKTYLNNATDQVLLGPSFELKFLGLPSGYSPGNPAYYIKGVGLTNLENPDPSLGFIGWFDAETGGNQITSIPVDADGPITLWARFQSTGDDDNSNITDPTTNTGEGTTLPTSAATAQTDSGSGNSLAKTGDDLAAVILAMMPSGIAIIVIALLARRHQRCKKG